MRNLAVAEIEDEMRSVDAAAQVQPKVTPCQACPLRNLKAFRQFTPTEVDFVSYFKSGELIAHPGMTILSEGAPSEHLYTILSGWSFRYKLLSDGDRQILNFALLGDLLGLQGSVFDSMGHSVEALTRSTLCIFPLQKLWTLYEKHPDLAFDITWLASREERIIDEHLISVGRRSATQRVAFLLMSLYSRCVQAGIAEGGQTVFPLTQQHLADALGLSVVHTNKVLRRLTDRELIFWRSGTLQIRNETGLRELSLFSNEEPRNRPFI